MSIVNKVDQFCAGIIAAQRASNKADAEFGRKSNAALLIIIHSLDGADPINSLQWESYYSTKAQMAMEGSKLYADADSLKSAKARYKVVAICASNGMEAKEGEGIKEYVKRGREEAVTKGWYTPANRGGAKPGKTSKKHGKVTKVSREAALTMIVGTDKADQQVVEFLVKHHMDALRTLYTQFNKVAPKA